MKRCVKINKLFISVAFVTLTILLCAYSLDFNRVAFPFAASPKCDSLSCSAGMGGNPCTCDDANCPDGSNGTGKCSGVSNKCNYTCPSPSPSEMPSPSMPTESPSPVTSPSGTRCCTGGLACTTGRFCTNANNSSTCTCKLCNNLSCGWNGTGEIDCTLLDPPTTCNTSTCTCNPVTSSSPDFDF